MYQELLPQHSILYSRMISFRFYLTLEIWDVQSQPQNSILKWGSTSTCVGYTHGHVHRILPLTPMHLSGTDLDSFPSVRLNCSWKGGLRWYFSSISAYGKPKAILFSHPESSAVHSPLRPMTSVQGFELWSLYCLAQVHPLLSLPAPVTLETRGKSFCLSHMQHKLHWHHDKCRLAVRKETTSLETAPTAQTGRSYQEVATDKF